MCQLKILLHPAPHQVEDEVLVDQKQAEKMILQGHGDYTNSITETRRSYGTSRASVSFMFICTACIINLFPSFLVSILSIVRDDEIDD